jgi:hypothetical protein
MPTIYVDGGARTRPSAAAFPTVSVGDGDSFHGTLDQILPRAKDYSDLAFALRALPPSVRRVCLEGFLGGRRDHELAGFGEVHAFLSARAPAGFVVRVDFSGAGDVGGAERVVAFAGGEITLAIHGVFSVFVLAPVPAIRISGACAFPFAGPLQSLSSVGLSNEGHGSVRLESRAPCFILLPS